MRRLLLVCVVLAGNVPAAVADLVAEAGPDLWAWEGSLVTLDGSGSTGDIVHTRWGYGDGEFTDDQLVVNHAYGDDGQYVAMLEIWDNASNRDWDTAIVTVDNVPPTAYTPDRTVVVGQDTEYVGSCTDPGWNDTHTYAWDWDRDEAWDDTGQTAHWTFTSEGQFTIALRVTDDEGDSDVCEAAITVVPEPAALSLLAVGGLALLRRKSRYGG